MKDPVNEQDDAFTRWPQLDNPVITHRRWIRPSSVDSFSGSDNTDITGDTGSDHASSSWREHSIVGGSHQLDAFQARKARSQTRAARLAM